MTARFNANNLGSNDENEEINNILAELIQDAPEDVQEPQLTLQNKWLQITAQLEAIAAEEAAAKAADENAPPK